MLPTEAAADVNQLIDAVNWEELEMLNPDAFEEFPPILDDVLIDLPISGQDIDSIMEESSSNNASSPEESSDIGVPLMHAPMSKQSLFYPPLPPSSLDYPPLSKDDARTKRNARMKAEPILEEVGIDSMMKKQQRMMRNRESASLSRKRRKEYLENLESQVKDLGRQLQSSKEHIQRLEAENQQLKHELSVVRGHPVASMMKPAAVGGVATLMVCLLCFGMFATSLPGNAVGGMSVRRDVPMLAAHTASQTRTLQSISNANNKLQQSTNLAVTSERSLSPQRVLPMSPISHTWNDTEFAGWIQQRLKESVKESESHTGVVSSNDVAVVDSSAGEYPVYRMHEKHRPLLFSTIKRRSDTSYIFCTEVQFFPGSTASEDGTQHMSLIFPSQTSDLYASDGASSDELFFVEVDCNVMNTKVVSPHISNDTVTD